MGHTCATEEGALDLRGCRVERDSENSGGLGRRHGAAQRMRCERTLSGSIPFGIGSWLLVSELSRLLTATTSARVSLGLNLPRRRLIWCSCDGLRFGTDLEGGDRHVRQDPADRAALLVEHARGAGLGAFRDEDHSRASDSAVDGVLRLGVDGDRHLAAAPPTAQRAAEHGPDCTGLPGDLGVRRLLRAPAEHHETEQHAEQHADDDPEREHEAVALVGREADDEAGDDRQQQRAEQPPGGRRIEPPGHLEDVPDLTEPSRLFRLGLRLQSWVEPWHQGYRRGGGRIDRPQAVNRAGSAQIRRSAPARVGAAITLPR